MPIVNFPEFEQYRSQGFKGVFVGGCVSRGDGSSFRAKAHAHNEPYIKVGNEIVKDEQGNPKLRKHFGWICVRSAKRLYTRPGQPSNLMWHEMAHILTPGHAHDDVWRKKAREFGVHIGKRYEKQRRPAMANKNGSIAVAAEVAVVAEQEVQQDPIMALIGDPGAKMMGPAKDGGSWYKNGQSGKLYRIQEINGEHKLMETREPAPAANKKAKKIADGPSRQALMEQAKSRGIKYHRILSKAELIQSLAKETTPDMIVKIQEGAIKRWKNGSTRGS